MTPSRFGSSFEGTESTGAGSKGTAALVEQLVADRVASRLFAGDAALWGEEAEPEASIRLGWTDFAARAAETIAAAESLRNELHANGVDRIVLCGMGGSSLAPEVIAARAKAPLAVLDSTHPEQVRRALGGDLSRTAVVVSSKSGSTIETRSHRAAFEAAFRDAGIDPAERVIVVTDPGSPLEASALEAGQRVFLADPNVGGRYSALTAFGLVPASLAGVDARALVAEAETVRETLAEDSAANPALQLAAAIASGLPERYALAIAPASSSDEAAGWGLGEWVEQLIAESTGKEGRGVLPVPLSSGAPELLGIPPRTAGLVTVSAGSSTGSAQPPVHGTALVAASLGAQFLVWETATAVLGRLMGINPFDQPDVESAKVAARAVLNAGAPTDDRVPVVDAPQAAEIIAQVRASVTPDGYLSVQAYLDREGDAALSISALRNSLAEALGVPVTLGWGPRFLHSTGQLHKGGPPVGAFLQLLDTSDVDVAIPDADSSFGALISAQAAGDRNVLIEHGRPVIALRTADPAGLANAIVAVLAESPTA